MCVRGEEGSGTQNTSGSLAAAEARRSSTAGSPFPPCEAPRGLPSSQAVVAVAPRRQPGPPYPRRGPTSRAGKQLRAAAPHCCWDSAVPGARCWGGSGRR